MATTNAGPQTALKFEAEIGSDGRLELQVRSVAGERVVGFLIAEIAETFSDLTAAAESSLDFWDNPLDAEDWNYA